MAIKTLCIFGTRPEAIKMAPVVKALNANLGIENKVCVTGQHQQMLERMLQMFNIKPDLDLQVMTVDQSLSSLTAKILLGLTKVFDEFSPDLVLVHGDTTTALASSLSSYYHQIPIAHVEAGLRTGNIYLPWPEEANRKLTGALAKLHFAPTQSAKQNLLREGVSENDIYITGNTVIDALFDTIDLIEQQPKLLKNLRATFSFLSPYRRMILVTGHRRESFGEGFQRICRALAIIAERFPNVDIVYPVHLNPNVQKPVKSMLNSMSNIYLIETVDYISFVYLMKSSYIILTDSGGIQEEAPSLGKPVLVMRDVTERPEAVEAGTVKLVGTDVELITSEIELLLTNNQCYQKMSLSRNPYGDGKATNRIVKTIMKEFAPSSENLLSTNYSTEEIGRL